MKNKVKNSNILENTTQKAKDTKLISKKIDKQQITIKKEISKKLQNTELETNQTTENTTIEHIIIGIDPGLHKMGVGIIKYNSMIKYNSESKNSKESKNNSVKNKQKNNLIQSTNTALSYINNKPQYVAHHLCLTKPTHSLENRLQSLHNQLNELIKEYKPTAMVIEEIFAGVNRNTIIKLSMARTIPILCAAEHNIKLLHLPTRMVKQYITGQGSAEKDLVAKQVCNLLGVDFIDNLDATDALACALCNMYY